MKRHLKTSGRLGAALVSLALLATACGSDGGDGGSDGEDKTITFAVIPGWTDQTSTTYLLKSVLEDNGYEVEVKELGDNAPVYTALGSGDVDILTSSWLELTHKTYWEKFGDKLEDHGVYYEGATSFLAVPEYMDDINSIEDLPANADQFGGQITGIEPGAGLTEMTQTSVIPEYGLDKDFELLTSSTAAMLAELGKKIDDEEPIVITMWAPFWANLAYPIKALEDPKGAYGDPENLHKITREGFGEDQPEVTAMLEAFVMDQEQYESLENMMVNDFGEGQEDEAVDAWLEENPDFVKPLEDALNE